MADEVVFELLHNEIIHNLSDNIKSDNDVSIGITKGNLLFINNVESV